MNGNNLFNASIIEYGGYGVMATLLPVEEPLPVQIRLATLTKIANQAVFWYSKILFILLQLKKT